MMNGQYSISECIARWGNSASVALLDPGCQIFSTPEVAGIIGYRQEAHNIIVFGDPLCESDDLTTLMSSFHRQFQDSTKNIIYVAVTEKFKHDSLGTLCHASIGIGQEMILDPTDDPRLKRGDRASLLRGKCNQAARKGVVIHEYTQNDIQIENEMVALGEAWVSGRQGPQIYLHHVDIFAHREHKRYFYAQIDGKIIGELILHQIAAYKGWVISMSMVDPQAPKGTSELLIVSTLEILAKENCHYFAIGTIPTNNLHGVEGLNPLTTWVLNNAYSVALKTFHLEDRGGYWTKFHPTTESTYLLLTKPKLGVGGALGIISALNASKK